MFNPATSISFKATVAELRSVVGQKNAAAEFFVAAYLSWFSHSGPPMSLHSWAVLDARQRSLFERMLRLRDGDNWSFSALVELEAECCCALKPGAPSALPARPRARAHGAIHRTPSEHAQPVSPIDWMVMAVAPSQRLSVEQFSRPN